jgi:hypothetical protein
VPAFLALNGAAVLGACVFAVALGLDRRWSRLFLGALAGYLIIVHTSVLAAGLSGQLTVAGLAGVVGVATAASLWLVRRTGRGITRVRCDGGTDDRGFTVAALVLPVTGIIVGLAWSWPHLFHATRFAVWDDYTYHMVYPALWLREQAIAAVIPAHTFTFQAWYPLSASLVAAWFMAPFQQMRGEALAWVSLTGILYTGIVAAGAAELLGRLGCRRGAWAVPVVLLATSQRIDVMASSFSDADLAVAAALFAAFAFAVPRAEAERGRDVAVDAVYAGLLSGIALGVKVSAGPVGLIILGMLVIRAGGLAREARSPSMIRTAVTFAVAWTATGGYWYGRNIIHTGNPVYPAPLLLWPGVTFPETTLFEYSRRYGLPRTVRDALDVYMNWPPSHAVVALVGLLGLAGWLALRWRSTTPARRLFAYATLAIVATTLLLLPAAPFSAGNAETFRSGFIHGDSMRYVALLPILGWTALGFLIDGGAGAPWGRTLTAALIAAAGLMTSATAAAGATLAVLAVVVALLARPWRHASPPSTMRHGTVAAAVIAMILAAVVVGTHGRKAAATGAAVLRDPLFGGAVAVLDRQPPGTRVTVFGNQWVYPLFGDRHQFDPVRLDRDGRIVSALIGPRRVGDLTVDVATFRANLRASGVGVVVIVHPPHPGRSAEWPTQHVALEATADARLLYRDRAVAVWKLDR